MHSSYPVPGYMSLAMSTASVVLQLGAAPPPAWRRNGSNPLPHLWGAVAHWHDPTGDETKDDNLRLGNGAGEWEQLATAVHIVRTEFYWDAIADASCTTHGIYPHNTFTCDWNFSAYEPLLQQLAEQQPPVRPWLILGRNVIPVAVANFPCPGAHCGEDLPGFSPISAQWAENFTQFAVAAMRHFRGRRVIWELWNEPNGGGWLSVAGKPNVTEYIALAKAVGEAKMADSDLQAELLLGPGASGLAHEDPTQPTQDYAAFEFIKACFEAGLLEYFDGISVHPYRPGGPESVIGQYQDLQRLIATHTPVGRSPPPIVQGEWGWSTCVPPCDSPSGVSEDIQARYSARQWLVNELMGVPISILYDYLDDCSDNNYTSCLLDNAPGGDAHVLQDRYGMVRFAYHNSSIPHVVKPAYTAAATLQGFLGGERFESPWRLQATVADGGASADDYVLAFQPKQGMDSLGIRYAFWTAVEDPAHTRRNISFRPIRSGSAACCGWPGSCFRLTDYLGRVVAQRVCPDEASGTLVLEVSSAPFYLEAV